MAVAEYFVQDFAAARPLIAQSAAVARTLGDTRGVAAAQVASAELEFAAGAVDTAIEQIRAMIDSGHHNLRLLALGYGNLASYLLAAGRVGEAKLAALAGLREARALGWRAAVVRIVEHLSLVAILSGETEAAARLLGYGVAFYATGTASREFTEACKLRPRRRGARAPTAAGPRHGPDGRGCGLERRPSRRDGDAGLTNSRRSLTVRGLPDTLAGITQ